MQRLTILLLLVGLGVGMMPVSLAQEEAFPLDDLTVLAGYFPESAPIFGAMRTDDAYIDALDEVLAQFSALTPQAPELSLRAELDRMAQDADSDFDTLVRSWLGDTAAFAITETSLRGAHSGMIAVSVTDRKAAERLLDETIDEAQAEKVEEENYTQWTMDTFGENSQVHLILRDDVLLYFTDYAHAQAPPPLDGPGAPLSESLDFEATLRLLPGKGYDIAWYLNTQALVPLFKAMTKRRPAADQMMPIFNKLAEARGSYAVGMALLDSRALTVDIVGTWADTDALEAAGFTLARAMAPVDLDFAEHVPAGAPLVVLGSELGSDAQMAFDNMRALDAWMEAEGITLAPPRAQSIFEGVDFGDLIAFVTLTYRGMTGLDLEEDIFPLMDGANALFLRFGEGVCELMPGAYIPQIDAAYIIETTDADKLQSIMDTIAEVLEQNAVKFVEETMDGARAIIVPTMPVSMELSQLDVVFGAKDGLYAFGTRGGVAFGLNPTEDTLITDPAFTAAQAYMLPGAHTIAYMNTGALLTAVDDLETVALAEAYDEARVRRDFDQLRTLLGLFESGTITQVTNDNGDDLVRLVLTLAE